MARPWSDDEAGRLVQAFREHGPNFASVADRVGRDRRTVARAWEKGVRASKRSNFKGNGPVRDTIAREQVQARAAIAVLNEVPSVNRAEALERMTDQVVDARIQTGHVLRELKASVVTMSPAVKELAFGAGDLCHRLAEVMRDVEIVARRPCEGQMSLAEAMLTMKDIVGVLSTVAQTVRTLTDMERRELGEPTAIVKTSSQMTDEEAMQFIVDSLEVFRDIDLTQVEPEEHD